MDCFVRLALKFRSLSYQDCLQHGRDIRPDRPFTPTNVYEMLDVIKSSLRVGGQEDAEEFLSCILNGFHEEILKLFALLPSGINIDSNGYSDDQEVSSETDVGASFANSKQDTPISNIFRGEMCITVSRPEQKPSISHETFFTLPSTLPPILILHLKRFIYDKNGGLLKVDKKVNFKTDLIIELKWLSESAQNCTLEERTYKLFAVVYHHGIKATGGHYTADVFHIGMRSWLHFDDQTIYPIKQHDVLTHSSKRTPYLLYYRQLRI